MSYLKGLMPAQKAACATEGHGPRNMSFFLAKILVRVCTPWGCVDGMEAAEDQLDTAKKNHYIPSNETVRGEAWILPRRFGNNKNKLVIEEHSKEPRKVRFQESVEIMENVPESPGEEEQFEEQAHEPVSQTETIELGQDLSPRPEFLSPEAMECAVGNVGVPSTDSFVNPPPNDAVRCARTERVRTLQDGSSTLGRALLELTEGSSWRLSTQNTTFLHFENPEDRRPARKRFNTF